MAGYRELDMGRTVVVLAISVEATAMPHLFCVQELTLRKSVMINNLLFLLSTVGKKMQEPGNQRAGQGWWDIGRREARSPFGQA